jgi:hypothetical protein
MMRGYIFALAAICCLSNRAVSEEAKLYDTMGAGTISCGEFARSHRKNDPPEVLFFTWAQGFMTGLNVAGFSSEKLPPRNLAGTAMEHQLRHVRSFCDRRPLAQYYEAVVDLFQSLPVTTIKTPNDNR